MTPRALERWIRPLARQVRLMVARGIALRTDDAGERQTLQGSFLADELLDGVEHPQPYGFTARAHPGAEVVGVCVGGRREQLLALVVGDRRYRLRGLAEGEVALYTDEGDRIHLKRSGRIEITAGSQVTVNAPQVKVEGGAAVTVEAPSVTLDAPSVLATGNLAVLGSLQVTGAILGLSVADALGSLGALRTDYLPHVHDQNPSGVTGPPHPPE